MSEEQPPVHVLVRKAYRKNHDYALAYDREDSVSIRTEKWPIEENKIRFEQDEFPYFRLALLDMYLEDKFG